MTDAQDLIRLEMSVQSMAMRRFQPIRNRTTLRYLLLSTVVLGDSAAIVAESLLANAGLLEVTSSEYRLRLLYLIVPAYWISASALGGYSLPVLKTPVNSIGRALLSLAVALCAFALTIRQFELAVSISHTEAIRSIAIAALGLIVHRWCIAAVLQRNAHRLQPGIVLLGDESVKFFNTYRGAKRIDVRECHWSLLPDDPNFLNDLSAAVAGADRIVLSFRAAEECQQWGRLMGDLGLSTELLEPNLASMKPLGLRYFGSTPTLVISRGPLTLGERTLKRTLDLLVVFLALPIVVPLACVLAILIRIDSPGPVLFVQRRIGLNNRFFNCLKFRTMRVEAANQSASQLTQRNDQRVTKVGEVLRRTSLDELPQLWNVIKGEMSLVGPRPHALGATAEGALYWKAVPGYWQRHSVRPGLTGLAQVRGYRGPTEKKGEIERRVAADLEYINNWSLLQDTRILVKTLTVLMHQNAF